MTSEPTGRKSGKLPTFGVGERKSGKLPLIRESPSVRIPVEKKVQPIDMSRIEDPRYVTQILDLGDIDEASKVRRRLEIKIEALKAQGIDPRIISRIVDEGASQRAFEVTDLDKRQEIYLRALYQISLLYKEDFYRHINGLVHRLGAKYLRPYGLNDRNSVIRAILKSDVLRDSLRADDMIGVNLIVRSITPEIIQHLEDTIVAGSNPLSVEVEELGIMKIIISEFGVPTELESFLRNRKRTVEFNIERERINLSRITESTPKDEVNRIRSAYKSYIVEKDGINSFITIVNNIISRLRSK